MPPPVGMYDFEYEILNDRQQFPRNMKDIRKSTAMAQIFMRIATLSVSLLPSPYSTKCIKYELTKYRSQEICVHMCILNRCYEHDNRRKQKWIEGTVVPLSTNMSFEFYPTELVTKYLPACTKVCAQSDCEFNYFDDRIERIHEKEVNKTIAITFIPEIFPYARYVRHSTHSGFELIAKLGGTISVCLGICIIDFYIALTVSMRYLTQMVR